MANTNHLSKPDSALLLSTHANRKTILISITQALTFVVLIQSSKLFFLPENTSTFYFEKYWHAVNMLCHTAMFIFVLVTLKCNRVRLAKYCLLLSFFSYISIASYLWLFDVHLQFYFLLSMFICCYIFDYHEKHILYALIAIQVILFLCLQQMLVPIQQYQSYSNNAIEQEFLKNILVINTIVFAFSCVICALFIRNILTQNWQQLSQLKKTQTVLLEKLFPPQLMPRLMSSHVNVSEMQSSAQLGIVFLDICDFTSLSLQRVSYDIHPPKDSDNSLDWQRTFELFGKFDSSVASLQAKRIKTNGDQYILLVGLQDDTTQLQHQLSKHEIANKTIDACKVLRSVSHIDIKIGAAFGFVTYGIFDNRYPNFDIWGETVIKAARLEALAKANEICIDQSLQTVSNYKEAKYTKEATLKGLGKQTIYYL